MWAQINIYIYQLALLLNMFKSNNILKNSLLTQGRENVCRPVFIPGNHELLTFHVHCGRHRRSFFGFKRFDRFTQSLFFFFYIHQVASLLQVTCKCHVTVVIQIMTQHNFTEQFSLICVVSWKCILVIMGSYGNEF